MSSVCSLHPIADYVDTSMQRCHPYPGAAEQKVKFLLYLHLWSLILDSFMIQIEIKNITERLAFVD